MSKDEAIEELLKDLKQTYFYRVASNAHSAFAADRMAEQAAHHFYSKGYRNVEDLKKWLEETKKEIDKVYEVDTYNMGYADAINAILKKLESL